MSAGTLTLTNNSDVVNGTGTSLGTELAAGDFTVVVVGGITYTLAVKSVDSATKLTLASKYPGPSATGLAWNAVPRATQNQITAAVVAQATEALRGLNYDKQNWQQIFGNSGNITVRLPDGTTFSGPSWNKIAAIVATVDIDQLQILATQIDQDAAQVAADKTSAAGSASTATTAAGTATTKAGEASASAGTATTKAGEASDSAELARKWAVNAEDVVVSGGEYSSYHWAQKAEKSAAEAASHNPVESLVKSQNLSDLADRAAAWLNLRPTGSTPIAADAVNDYDAPTLRQVRNMVGAGTVGPTMNGVMNYGVGNLRLQDSRAYIAPYEVYADGQLLDRALWPELWAYAQLNTPISDADWVADPTKRGNYSSGNGTTTFRVPDRNGTQRQNVNGFTGPNSTDALFGRGDGGDSSVAGIVSPSGLPNIKGNFDIRFGRASGGNGTGIYLAGSGALFGSTLNTGALAEPMQLASQGTNTFQRVEVDASRSSAIYGRTINELRPNSFFAVWVIRASGGFVAANTSWSVINGDKAATPDVYVSGGQVISKYQINGVDRAIARMTADWRVGDAYASTIHFYNNSIKSDGTAITDAHYYLSGPSGQVLTDVKAGLGGTGGIPTESNANANNFTINGVYAGAGDNGVNWGDKYSALLHMSRYVGSSRAQLQIDPGGTLRVRGGNSTTWFAWLVMQAQGTSGREFKRDITPADPKEALDRIASQDLVTFIYKDDEQERVRFGIIAENAEKIAPQYIKHDEETVEVDGEVITRDHPRVDVNPIIMDLMGCVQALKAEIDLLKAQLSERTM